MTAPSWRVTDRFVSRTMRLPYLSPDVLERLLHRREPPAVTVNDLIGVIYLTWEKQPTRVLV